VLVFYIRHLFAISPDNTQLIWTAYLVFQDNFNAIYCIAIHFEFYGAIVAFKMPFDFLCLTYRSNFLHRLIR